VVFWAVGQAIDVTDQASFNHTNRSWTLYKLSTDDENIENIIEMFKPV